MQPPAPFHLVDGDGSLLCGKLVPAQVVPRLHWADVTDEDRCLECDVAVLGDADGMTVGQLA